MRKIAFSILTFSIFFFVLEGAFRVYLSFKDPNPQRVIDDKLGWKLKSDFSAKLIKNGIGIISFSTEKYGFRKWGDINSTKKRILIIGDSYTEANQINDGKCYYNYIDSTNYEVFTYGCSGYGTLQELMFIKPILNIIKPDLIIWQYCHNDLINNSFELEKRSLINNLLVKKPFLINNNIEYKIPNENYLIGILEQHFKLILWVNYKINNFIINNKKSIESEFDKNKKEFKEAFHTTKSIFTEIKKIKYPVVVFSVTTSYGYSEINEISNQLNIPFLNSVNTRLDSLTNKGIKLDLAPYDWHWNERGHKEAGLVLNKELSNYL